MVRWMRYDTALLTQNSTFEPWLSEAEHSTSRSQKFPKYWILMNERGRNNLFLWRMPEQGLSPRSPTFQAVSFSYCTRAPILWEIKYFISFYIYIGGLGPTLAGDGPSVVVSTAAFHTRGSVPGLGGLKETKMFLPHSRVKLSIVGGGGVPWPRSSVLDHQGSNFKFCVWRTVSSHHPQEVLLAQFSLYVHKGGA